MREKGVFLNTIIWILFNILGETQLRTGIHFGIVLLRIHFFGHYKEGRNMSMKRSAEWLPSRGS